MAVKFGGVVYKWKFLLAAVAFPLLGAHFLKNFKLVVDLHSISVYKRGGKPVQMVAPPVGSTFSLVGVQPAAAVAVPSSSPGPGPGPSTPSPLQPRLISSGSPPSAQHVVPTAAAVVAAPYRQLLEKFPDVVWGTAASETRRTAFY
jgi:hypothetical protein